MQQLFTNNGSVTIIADVREIGSLVTTILKKKCEVREQQLTVADYLLSERVAVERKTTQDFISSVVDGRLFRQLPALKETYAAPVLLVEGDDLFHIKRDVHPNAIRGALASVAIEYIISTL